MYVHGGGWICPGKEVQIQQLTPLVRAGLSVFSINYPLGPWERFPTALVSVLRAAAWVRKQGYQELHFYGASAGGNLITMAAALMCNRPLLEALAAEVDEPLCSWDYPTVVSVVSCYGILDRDSWAGHARSRLCAAGLQYCFDAYESASDVFGNRMTLLEVADEITDYPPMLLIVADTDPTGLQSSSHLAFETMRGIARLEKHHFPGTHGFVEYPPQIQSGLFGVDWEQAAKPANDVIVRWLGGGYTSRAHA
jgi:acetyl esterase/lipase